MRPPVHVHHYTLTLRGASGPNARSTRRTLHGALLRQDDGFACLQPWPEFGDAPLAGQLAALATGRDTPLLRRCRACLAADAAARRAGRSLFTGVAIPPSHATLTESSADFPALRAAGFTAVKLKARPDDSALTEAIRAAAAAGLSVRLDWNGTATPETLAALAPVAALIEFMEDPVPWDAAAWRRLAADLGIPLALDFLLHGADPEAGAFAVRVLKPARDDPHTWCARPEPVVFTSSMDHPIGQLWAAAEAARWPGAQRAAGLLTHHLFEPDAFTEALAASGPHLVPPAGTGLGFDDLLDDLAWQPLARPDTVFIAAPQPPAADPVPWDPDGPGVLLANPRAPLPDPPPPGAIPRGHLVFPTSGSTGSGPSLVCIAIPAFLANAAAVNAWLDVRPHDVWLRALPAFHVGGLAIHARARLAGIPVVVDEERWNPSRFSSLVAAHQVSLVSLVPAQVHDLVTAGLEAPPSLRAILVGGGPLPPSLAAAARSLGWPVMATYGMTEASSQIATACPHGDPLALHLLPGWEARTEPDGRLAIRGAPLLSGRLVPRDGTWSLAPALAPDGFFLTNDRATLSDRVLRFLGRSDRVVKILGELVDLDAVERALTDAGMPPESGCVIPVDHPRRGVALVFLTEADAATAGRWLRHAEASLPPFARVAEVRAGLALPRSPLGKLLRAAAAALAT
jgi:hypothetical protein